MVLNLFAYGSSDSSDSEEEVSQEDVKQVETEKNKEIKEVKEKTAVSQPTTVKPKKIILPSFNGTDVVMPKVQSSTRSSNLPAPKLTSTKTTSVKKQSHSMVPSQLHRKIYSTEDISSYKTK